MFGLISKKKAYKNIENLIRLSFEEGSDLNSQSFEYDNTYLVRSKSFWGIDHFLSYVKKAINDDI